jgi:hypothetical protein
MSTALVLSGQPRFFEITYKYFFSNLIETLQADVYFHTWWTPEMVGDIYPCAVHAKSVLDDDDMLIREDTQDKLRELYKPVDDCFDDYYVLPEHQRKPNYYQFYTQWVAGQLLKKRYDLVIRSRFDLMCRQDIEILQDDNVWVASCCPYTGDGTGRFNDLFSISSHDNFLKLSETYLNLPAFEAEGKGEMEWALAAQVAKERLTVKTFPASYDRFDILRSSTAKQYPI